MFFFFLPPGVFEVVFLWANGRSTCGAIWKCISNEEREVFTVFGARNKAHFPNMCTCVDEL